MLLKRYVWLFFFLISKYFLFRYIIGYKLVNIRLRMGGMELKQGLLDPMGLILII